MIKGIVNGVEKDIYKIPMFVDGVEKNGWEVRKQDGTLIWGREDTLTVNSGTMPVKGYGVTLKQVEVEGNTSQSGTPTPSDPIPVNGTGERTRNLWDEDYTNISTSIIYSPVYVGAGSFTLSTSTPYDYDLGVANIFLLSGNVSRGANTGTNGVWQNHNVTVQSDGGYVTIAYRQYKGISPANCRTMLSSGQTALPYEPYGYKIPITAASVTTQIYLGHVETTRRIKKLMLTGNEYWAKSRAYAGSFYAQIIGNYLSQSYTAYCSHLTFASSMSVYSAGKFAFNGDATANCNLWFNQFDVNTTITEFKTYLQQQYANGTPVTIWYVLASPETGIVNEPIMKIGEYADTLTITDQQATITPAVGSDTITVDTTLPPTKLTVVGHIRERNT